MLIVLCNAPYTSGFIGFYSSLKGHNLPEYCNEFSNSEIVYCMHQTFNIQSQKTLLFLYEILVTYKH